MMKNSTRQVHEDSANRARRRDGSAGVVRSDTLGLAARYAFGAFYALVAISVGKLNCELPRIASSQFPGTSSARVEHIIDQWQFGLLSSFILPYVLILILLTVVIIFYCVTCKKTDRLHRTAIFLQIALQLGFVAAWWRIFGQPEMQEYIEIYFSFFVLWVDTASGIFLFTTTLLLFWTFVYDNI